MHPSPLRSLSPRRPAASSGPNRRPRRSLGLESLEVRRVLSAAPFVTGLYLAAPAAPGAGSLDYLATFSEAVTGVDAADFRVNGTGVTVTNKLVVEGQGTTYRLRVSGIAGQGTLGVDLVNDGSIRDASGVPLTRELFPTARSVTTGGRPLAVHLTDLDADDRVDMVAATGGTSGVTIHRGDGSGGFTRTATLPTRGRAYSVASGDLDGDGRKDIVVVDNDSGLVGVSYQSRERNFTPFVFMPSGSRGTRPSAIAVADFNRDGRDDLVVTNAVGDSTTIFYSRADRTLWSNQELLTGSATDLAIVDFNSDGWPDLYVSSSAGRVIGFENRRTSAFDYAAAETFTVSSGASAIAAADINADGLTDLVLAYQHSHSISVMLRTANRSYLQLARMTSGDKPTAIAIADVNGDGRSDILSTNAGDYVRPSMLTILLGSGSGTFPQTVSVPTAAYPFDINAADLNRDGRTDLVVATETIAVFLQSDGVYPGERATIDRIAPAVRSITAVDQTTTPTTGGDLGFTIVFDETIDGFDTADLLVKATGTVTYASVDMAVKASLATVTIRGVRGTGTVRLGIDPAASISDTFGNPFDPTMTTGDSGAAAAVAIRSLATAPAAPTVDQLHHGLRVRWTEPASDGGTPVTGYRLEYRTGEADPWSTIDLPASFRTLDIPALPLRARCDVRISALTGNGLGAASPPTTALVVSAPLPPVAVTAVTAAGRATVHWQPPTDDGGSPITHYVVRYRAAGQPGWMVARTAPAGARSSVIDGLTADTAYEFRVASWNAVGGTPAAPTAPATIPLGPALAPTGVSATPIPGGVALRWSLPGDTGGSAVTGHIVEYRRLKDAEWKTFRGHVSAEANAIVTDLDAGGGNYLFRVRAVTRAGAGAASLPSRAVSVAPVMPVATIAAGTARIDWRAFGSADGQPVIDYVVEYRRLRDTIWSVYDGLSTGTSATLTGLSTGANYTFRVRARSAFGPGATSAASPAVTIR